MAIPVYYTILCQQMHGILNGQNKNAPVLTYIKQTGAELFITFYAISI